MYFLNYLPQARLNGLEEDLNLKGVEYNTAISILFVGYLLMQVPSNMFMTRTRPSIYLSCCMIAWATVSAATAAVKNYAGLVACRFFLGFVEAVSSAQFQIFPPEPRRLTGSSLTTPAPSICSPSTILVKSSLLASRSSTPARLSAPAALA